MNSKLAKLLVSSPPARYTSHEWELNNRTRTRFVKDQQQLADRIIAESDLLLDHTDFQLLSNKDDTNYSLKEKIENYKFKIGETNVVRRKLAQEIDDTSLDKERIMNTIAYVQNEGLQICKRCIILREGRIGIDLMFDDVERELLKELEGVEGALSLLKMVLDQASEQIRLLRADVYLMDRDLEDKEKGMKIDLHNLTLNETSLYLSVYHGSSPLANSNISEEQWNDTTTKMYDKTSKTLNNAVQLRLYINKVLSQAVEDLLEQFNITNEAFRRRIEETKETKTKLELHHYETTRQINEMTRNITRLEKTLAEKESFVALTHTRLGNRVQRPNMELCRDVVEVKLMYELQGFADNINSLQLMLCDSHASLRYMKKTLLQIEEDINVKTNTLKIDEVECMTLRQKLEYREY